MKKTLAAAACALLLSGAAYAQDNPKILTSVPAQSTTVNNWYKQNVYDTANNKIGEVMDVLLSPDGKVNALIVGVGGFLGMGQIGCRPNSIPAPAAAAAGVRANAGAKIASRAYQSTVKKSMCDVDRPESNFLAYDLLGDHFEPNFA